MYLKHLYIEGFRGAREPLQLGLHPRLNVLAGPNGAGKTTLLDAAAAMLVGHLHAAHTFFRARLSAADPTGEHLYSAWPDDLRFAEEVAGTDAHSFLRTLRDTLDRFDLAHFPTFPALEDLNLDARNITVGFEVDDRDGRHRRARYHMTPLSLESVLGAHAADQSAPSPSAATASPDASTAAQGRDPFSDLIARLWSHPDPRQRGLALAVSFPVDRNVLDIPTRVRDIPPFDHPLAALDHALAAGVDFRTFFTWFREREDLENERRLGGDPDHRDPQLSAVRRAITQTLDVFDGSSLRVQRSPQRMVIEKQGQQLSLQQLSDGERCALALVGDLARRLAIAQPGLRDPLQGRGVVLIDEIELHLHPRWQRQLLRRLCETFPRCQFIVTTHAPAVLSEVPAESIHLLRVEDHTLRCRRPDAAFGLDVGVIIEDLMGGDARPPGIRARLDALLDLIDEDAIDTAREHLTRLRDEIGRADDPELLRAAALLRRREVLGR